jgi:hypothetical protein
MFIACPRVSGMPLENYFIYAVELGCFDEVVFMLHDEIKCRLAGINSNGVCSYM